MSVHHGSHLGNKQIFSTWVYIVFDISELTALTSVVLSGVIQVLTPH